MVMKRIAIIGECMIELQNKKGGITQTFGGDTLNTAVYLSRLSKEKGVEVSYVTGLGQDKFSQEMLAFWQAEGINSDLVFHSKDKQTGLYLIETDPDGERHFFYWRNDSAAKYWLDQIEQTDLWHSFSDFDVIYLSGISLAILSEEHRQRLLNLLAACRKNGCLIAFDNNYRPQLWNNADEAAACYASALKVTDVALLTHDDEEALYGPHSAEEVIRRTHDFGVPEVVVKRGVENCLVSTLDEQFSVPSVKVRDVVDTTAAGDSFSAGYLAARLTGADAEEAATSGHLLASCVIQHSGAIFPIEFMPSYHKE